MLCYCVSLFIIPTFPLTIESECVESDFASVLKAQEVVKEPGPVIG